MSSNSVVHFDELLRSKPQNVRALAAEHPCSGRKTSVLCPRNVRALPAERPCSVHRRSVLCPQNVRAVSTERPCSFRGTSVLCTQNIRALSVHQCIICCPPTKWVTCKVANCSLREEESQWFPRCLSLEFTTVYPQILLGDSLHEVPMDSSWSVCGCFPDYWALLHACANSAETSKLLVLYRTLGQQSSCSLQRCTSWNATSTHFLEVQICPRIMVHDWDP